MIKGAEMIRRLFILLSIFVLTTALYPVYSTQKTSENYYGIIWSRNPKDTTLYGLAIDNGYLYTSDYKGHYCVNVDTGQTKWFAESEIDASDMALRYPDFNPKITKTTVSFVNREGIYGYDKATGKLKWSMKCKPYSDLSNHENSVSIVAFLNEIQFIDLEKGIIIKTISLKESVGEDRIVFRNDKYAVFVNHFQMIVYDLSTQNILFTDLLIDLSTFRNVPIINENKLYFYSKKNEQAIINCYDLTKHLIVWSQNIDYQSNILISGDRLFVGKICLDIHNGDILWNNNKIDFTSVNCLCNDRIVSFLKNGDYIIFKQDTGEIVCRDTRLNDIKDERSLWAMPVFYKNCIYLVSESKIFKLGPQVNTVSATIGSNYSIVGKQKVYLDDKPFMKSGIMYVNPVSIIEPLGGRVGGFSSKQYYNCIYNSKIVTLAKGKSSTKDKNNIDGCIEVNKTVFVPLRKLTDIYDLKLKWDAKTKTATISK